MAHCVMEDYYSNIEDSGMCDNIPIFVLEFGNKDEINTSNATLKVFYDRLSLVLIYDPFILIFC